MITQDTCPLTVILNINGEESTWKLGDPKKLKSFLKEMAHRGHRVSLIRSMVDLSLINSKTDQNTKAIWVK